MDIVAAPRGELLEIAQLIDGSLHRHTTLDLRAQPGSLSAWLMAPHPGTSVIPVEVTPASSQAPLDRWIWPRTDLIYAPILATGLRVERSVDLRLRANILAHHPAFNLPVPRWLQAPVPEPISPNAATHEALFAVQNSPGEDSPSLPEIVELFQTQEQLLARMAAGPVRQRLQLLLAAESTGALIAAEIHADGLPWDRSTHHQILTKKLGPRPAAGYRPPKMAQLSHQIATLLGRSEHGPQSLNIDHPPALLAALRHNGLDVQSTSKWEIAHLDHPVIEPLLEYKKLARLHSAHGWEWLDTWVDQAPPPAHELSPTPRTRFRPDYVPAGVVTGRWATRGGGAMQIPTAIRAAVKADPGWELVIADASQIEPRCLAGMSRDLSLAQAGEGDLYDGLVRDGVAPDRGKAKVAMLGALYGATTGASGELMPLLTKAYPQAVAMVEAAARTGEQGGQVHTWLGRYSPPLSQQWRQLVEQAHHNKQARQAQREQGRFARNFIVQGTAAEWAIIWMATIRRELRKPEYQGAYLAYFLHDEVIVHSPARCAAQVALMIGECAAEAGRLMFGRFPISFPLSVQIAESAAADH